MFGFSFGIVNKKNIKYPVNLIIPETIWYEPVIGIDDRDFQSCDLISLVIPRRVTFIDVATFGFNPLTSITIGENVTFGSMAFNFVGGFVQFYIDNGRKQGTYTRQTGSQFDGKWSYKPM
jgi:hypothetical protein